MIINRTKIPGISWEVLVIMAFRWSDGVDSEARVDVAIFVNKKYSIKMKLGKFRVLSMLSSENQIHNIENWNWYREKSKMTSSRAQEVRVLMECLKPKMIGSFGRRFLRTQMKKLRFFIFMFFHRASVSPNHVLSFVPFSSLENKS